MQNEGWMMKDDGWRGFWWLTEEQIGIYDCRVTFATEKIKKLETIVKRLYNSDYD